MKTINELAQAAADQFETKTRADGSSYTVFKSNDTINDNNALYQAVKAAHGDRMPNDWIYSTFSDLLDNLSGYTIDRPEDLEDVRHEIVDSYVDVYTHNLTKWLHEDINNVYYLTQAIEDYQPKDGFQALQMAQYAAIDEVMQEVINYLTSEYENQEEEEEESNAKTV